VAAFSRTAYVLVALALVLGQLALQWRFFPGAALLDATGISAIDAPFHVYQIELARELCAEHRVAGYDVRFGAGYTGGVTFNASAKLPAALHCLFELPHGAPMAYKQVSFWSGVLAPAMIAIAAALFGLGWPSAALAGAFAAMLWWTGPLRWYHTAGMVSFVFISFAAPALLAWVYRVTARPSWIAWLAIGFASALGFLIHPLFIVAIALLGMPIAVLCCLRAADWRAAALGMSAVLVLTLTCNFGWLYPSLTAPSFASTSTPYQRVVDPWLFAREMMGTAMTAAGGSRLYWTLFLGTLLCIWLTSGVQRTVLLTLSAGAVGCLAFSQFAGASEGLAQLQPNRFGALGWLALSLPGAAGIIAALRERSSLTAWRRKVLPGLAAVTLAPAGYYVLETAREVSAPPGHPRYGAQPPEARERGPMTRQLLEFLATQTDTSGRVLFENSLGRVHDGGHISGLLAWHSGRELIGGPYPYIGYPNAWDDNLFGADPKALSPERLRELFDTYNVRWAACHSAGCLTALRALSDARQVGAIGPVTLFERERSPGWFIQGAGVISAHCGNRLELQETRGNPIVLRYHWVPGLRSVPSGTVAPIVILPGTRPFVAVSGAPASFALRLGDGDGIPCTVRPGGATR
jgi:hypothetical protein